MVLNNGQHVFAENCNKTVTLTFDIQKFILSFQRKSADEFLTYDYKPQRNTLTLNQLTRI